MINLMVSSSEAMKGIEETRMLSIMSRHGQRGSLFASQEHQCRAAQRSRHVLRSLFTTKVSWSGNGDMDSRSIIELHGTLVEDYNSREVRASTSASLVVQSNSVPRVYL